MSLSTTPELLAVCLEGVKSGACSLDDFETLYPQQAEELRSLVGLAQRIESQTPPGPDAGFRQRGRAQLLAAIAEEKKPVTKPAFPRFWIQNVSGWWQPRQLVGRMGMPAIVIFVVMALAAMGSGSVYAAQDALPGDALYGIKTGVEGIQLSLAVDDEAKADTYLMLAEKRLGEIQKATETMNGDAAKTAAEAMANHVEMVERHMESAAASGKDISGFAAKMATKLAWGQNELQNAQDRLPKKAKDALILAANKSDEGMLQATDYLRSAHPDRAKATPPATPIGTPAPTLAVGTAVVVPTVVVSAPVTGTWTLTFSETISDVQELANDPAFSGQSYNGLLAKLQAAEAAATRGQGPVAVNVLEAFHNQLEAMKRSGRLSDADYQALTTRYESLVVAVSEVPSVKQGGKKSVMSPTPASTALPTATATAVPVPTSTAVAPDLKGLSSGSQPGNESKNNNQGQNKDNDKDTGKDKDKSTKKSP